ncbi:MAG: hypothetical protein LC655_06995, partial [Bacteroidales bacterium]|nr:hypothetical protein [Bacteroidales bacterium]
MMNRGWYLQWQYNAMGTRQLMSSGGGGGPTDDSNELPGLKGIERLYSLYPYFMNNLKIGKGIDIGSGKNGSNGSN